jgi:putative endonuclease
VATICLTAVKSYFVYIMASRSGTLYVGVTSDLAARVYEHKHSLIPGFTTKYRVNRLVYFEETNQVAEAIAREKQIKGWLRKKKIALVETLNPDWRDLSEDWKPAYATGERLLQASPRYSHRLSSL